MITKCTRLMVPGDLLDKMKAASEHFRLASEHADKAYAILNEMRDPEISISIPIETDEVENPEEDSPWGGEAPEFLI